MRIKSIVALLIIVLSGSTLAQVPKLTLNSQVTTSFPDNNMGAITPAIIRTFFTNIIASFQQYAGVNTQVGITYTFAISDYGQLVTFNNGSPIAVTLPQATGSFSTWNAFVNNLGAGTVTITPTISTINGAATYSVTRGSGVWIVSDGTNYQVFAGTGSVASVSNADGTLTISPTLGNVVASLALAHPNTWSGLQTFNNSTIAMLGNSTGVTTISSANASASNYAATIPANTGTVAETNLAQLWIAPQTFNNSDIILGGNSTGVTTISNANASASNFIQTLQALTATVTDTLSSGALALNTTAIASGMCSAVQAVSATNTLSTDAIIASFNADPTAVTGYIPSTAGMLTIIPFPTSGNANFRVCNNTTATITPGNVTINWRVVR